MENLFKISGVTGLAKKELDQKEVNNLKELVGILVYVKNETDIETPIGTIEQKYLELDKLF